MKERISVLFKSKTFYIIFSILLAIGSWLLVISSQNASESRSLEVPITFINRNTLSENDLVDDSPTTQPTKVTVKVSGSETFIEKLQPSDIYVEVDYQEVTKPGAVTLKIKKPICDTLGVTVDSYYPTEIDCVYDKKIEKYVDITVDWDESLMAEGITIVNTVAEPASILITGFSMLLDQVSSVRVNLADALPAGSITESGTTNLVCRFYNADGDDISSNFSTEKVMVRYTTGKVVPIKYTITGNPDSDYYVVSHMPSATSLVLTGDASATNNIFSINLGDISVQGAKSNFTKTIQIKDLLPEGVSAPGVDSIEVTVNIEPYTTKEININADNLKKVGENGDYLYTYILSNSKISVKGTYSSLNKLTDSSLSYSLDVSGKNPGTYVMDLKFNLPDNVQLQGQYTCSIEIEAKATATISPSSVPTETPIAASPTIPLTPEPSPTIESTEEPK